MIQPRNSISVAAQHPDFTSKSMLKPEWLDLAGELIQSQQMVKQGLVFMEQCVSISLCEAKSKVVGCS